MNVIIYGDAPEYSHLLTTYFRRKVDNEHIRFIIRNRSGDTDVKKLISRGGEGYPVELRVDRDLWNERLHSLCKKNRVYLVSFDERGLL